MPVARLLHGFRLPFPPIPGRLTNTARGLRSAVSSPLGFGALPRRKRIFVYFELENRIRWLHFYRAMLVVLARYCYRIGRPSVCLSVTLMYREHIRWTSSKLITRTIIIGTSILGATTRQSSPRGTPLKFGWNRGEVALLSRKPAISLKRGNVGLTVRCYC